MGMNYTPIEAAIALSLYAFNVDPGTRANRLWDHFGGACMDSADMERLFLERGEFAATELPYPTAKVYIEHALARYGEQARRRVACEEGVI